MVRSHRGALVADHIQVLTVAGEEHRGRSNQRPHFLTPSRPTSLYATPSARLSSVGLEYGERIAIVDSDNTPAEVFSASNSNAKEYGHERECQAEDRLFVNI